MLQAVDECLAQLLRCHSWVSDIYLVVQCYESYSRGKCGSGFSPHKRKILI